MKWSRVVGLLSLCLSVHVGAQESDATVPATLLIYGGGATPEAAQASLDEFKKVLATIEEAQTSLDVRWKASGEETAPLLSMKAPFPTVISSDGIEGLNPGFHLVVIGACEGEAEAKKALAFLDVVDPRAYTRSVRWPRERLGCPVSTMTSEASATVKKKGRTLSVTVFRKDSPRDLSVATLTEKGKLLERRIEPLATDYSCEPGTLEPQGGGAVFEHVCEFEMCTIPGTALFRARWTLKDETIDFSWKRVKVLSRAECD